jgi:ApaG protein
MARLPVKAVYEARTRDILVRVQPAYLPAQSDPAKNQYTFSYTVEIENHGTDTVQLVTRHWVITDGHGRVERVDGPGVVGEQPTLKPREAFRYTSACPLTTPTGEMSGTYRFVTNTDEVFDAAIPAFSLHTPDAIKRMN